MLCEFSSSNANSADMECVSNSDLVTFDITIPFGHSKAHQKVECAQRKGARDKAAVWVASARAPVLPTAWSPSTLSCTGL